MSETTDLSQVWAAVEERLPPGWSIDGLRCASTGLAPGDRSEDWVAAALGPEGETRTYRAAEPEDALRGLATVSFQPTPDRLRSAADATPGGQR